MNVTNSTILTNLSEVHELQSVYPQLHEGISKCSNPCDLRVTVKSQLAVSQDSFGFGCSQTAPNVFMQKSFADGKHMHSLLNQVLQKNNVERTYYTKYISGVSCLTLGRQKDKNVKFERSLQYQKCKQEIIRDQFYLIVPQMWLKKVILAWNAYSK